MKQNITLILFCICVFYTPIVKSQEFSQLRVVEDTIEQYHSLLEKLNFDAFGKHKNMLLAFDAKELKLAHPIKNPIKIIDSKGKIWQFSTFNTETGKVNFFTSKIGSCVPISFLNNETLVVKDTIDNSFKEYSSINNKFISIPDSLGKLLNKLPKDFVHYMFKVSPGHDKLAILGRDNICNLNIFFYHNNNIIQRELTPNKNYKSWNCRDFFWIDNENMLLFLIRVNKEGNDLETGQAVYNLKSDQTEYITLPTNSDELEDFNSGQCIIRTKNDNPTFIMYKLKIINNIAGFEPTYLISTDNKPKDFVPHLGFISEDQIGFITYVYGEKGIIRLEENIKKGYCDYCKLDIRKYQAK